MDFLQVSEFIIIFWSLISVRSFLIVEVILCLAETGIWIKCVQKFLPRQHLKVTGCNLGDQFFIHPQNTKYFYKYNPGLKENIQLILIS